MPDPTPLPRNVIRARVEDALAAMAARPHTPGLEAYEKDRIAFLKSAEKLGDPELIEAEGKPVRFVTPLYWAGRVGGFITSCPFTGEVHSWPAWAPGPRPLFSYTIEEMERFVRQQDPRVHELVPRTIRTPSRFAVDPAKVADAYLLERYESLPFKNQEERYAWVEEVNRSGRMRTKWRHKGGYQEPSYKCLSFAASTVADWWGLVYGVPPTQTYQNLINGSQEYGINPREIEVLYYHRGRARNDRFYRLMPRLPVTLDPVTRERIPNSSTAFAHLICTPDACEVPDPLTRDGQPVYRYNPGMWHMDGPPRTLFTKGQADPAALREAIHRHGIVLAFTQARMLRVIRFGLHGIPIVGYFMKGGETYFIYHESYGNHGPGYVWDDSGGPAYMTIPGKMLREASCFPHRVWMDLVPDGGGAELHVTHSGGGPLDGASVTARAGSETLATSPAGPGRFRLSLPAKAAVIGVAVDREYFRREDGKPHEAQLPWAGPGAPAFMISRWLFLARQLESRDAFYRPPHMVERLAQLEGAIVEASRTPGFALESLLSLRQVVGDRDVTLLQSLLLPRLLNRGLDPALAARAMA